MKPALDVMNEFCYVLTQMERDGMMIDMDALDALEVEYEQELHELTETLHTLARTALGDTPFSLTSNEDMSMLIFSRRPHNKKEWAAAFNLGTEMVNGTRKNKRPFRMKRDELGDKIERLSSIVYKTTAYQCNVCTGTGKVARKRKDGTWGKPRFNCNRCGSCGVVYEPDYTAIAGFKQRPSTIEHLAAHGYAANKDRLIELTQGAKGDAKAFLTHMVRFNAITHYLNSFINGIRNNVGRDGILHTQFMQCVTKTGRLSSRNPNLHNMPRGGTFPIRKVVISRWEGGSITDADYSQLEFRVAAALAHDKQALKDITDGIDVHQRTASVLTEAGQTTSRQDAKSHTFKPLYGGTSGTRAEQEYYKWFGSRYTGISGWHKKILSLAVAYKRLTLPSGRPYSFPWAKMGGGGNVVGATKIKNYPVQGFATGDIVPVAAINVFNLMKEQGLMSKMINEVHDSIVVDTYPGEELSVSECLRDGMLSVIDDCNTRFDFKFTVPLAVEIKSGTNWMLMDTVMEASTQ